VSPRFRFSIHPCREVWHDEYEADDPGKREIVRCDEEGGEPEFWTVYKVQADGCSMAIGDFAEEKHARIFLAAMEGKICRHGNQIGNHLNCCAICTEVTP